ncbi:MAG TPA: TetR/AcrR family transcriptional regulator [Arachidicoccus sp.]
MTKAEQTRQFIIEAAAPIFNKKGYDSTSLNDVQEATKLTKGAIYGNFSDKNELAVAAFEYNCERVAVRVKTVMNEQATASSALYAYANYFVNNWQLVFSRGGCAMMNAAIEADDHLHFLRDNVRNRMKNVMKRLQLTIEKGQQDNEFKKEISAVEYASVIFAIMEGNILLAKTMNDPKYLQNAADRIHHLVEQELIA